MRAGMIKSRLFKILFVILGHHQSLSNNSTQPSDTFQ